jgi:hypothetical protein
MANLTRLQRTLIEQAIERPGGALRLAPQSSTGDDRGRDPRPLPADAEGVRDAGGGVRRGGCRGWVGRPDGGGALYHLLRNPVYAGKVKHRGTLHDGLHTAIIDEATWQRVQDLLDGNGGGPIAGRRAEAARWLDGRLFDRHGRPMRTTFATRSISLGSVRQSKRYSYYVSKPESAKDKRPLDRLPAGPLEGIVRDAIANQLADRAWVADALVAASADVDDLAQALARVE